MSIVIICSDEKKARQEAKQQSNGDFQAGDGAEEMSNEM